MKLLRSLTVCVAVLTVAPLLLAIGPPPRISTRTYLSEPGARPSPPPLVGQVVETAVMVEAGDAGGSGSFISIKGRPYVLTAAHVVEGVMSATTRAYAGAAGQVTVEEPPARTVTLHTKKGRSVGRQAAKVVWYDAKADLALLEPAEVAGVPRSASLAALGTECEPGEDVWYCGLGSGLPWNLVKTIVNQTDDAWLTVNGEGWYGHSGSGVFVLRKGRYELVGVVVQAASPRSPKTAVRCVTLAEVHRFLKAWGSQKK